MEKYNSVTIIEVGYLVIIQWWSAKVKYIDVSKVVWKNLVLKCLLYYLSTLICWELREYTKNNPELRVSFETI